MQNTGPIYLPAQGDLWDYQGIAKRSGYVALDFIERFDQITQHSQEGATGAEILEQMGNRLIPMHELFNTIIKGTPVNRAYRYHGFRGPDLQAAMTFREEFELFEDENLIGPEVSEHTGGGLEYLLHISRKGSLNVNNSPILRIYTRPHENATMPLEVIEVELGKFATEIEDSYPDVRAIRRYDLERFSFDVHFLREIFWLGRGEVKYQIR